MFHKFVSAVHSLKDLLRPAVSHPVALDPLAPPDEEIVFRPLDPVLGAEFAPCSFATVTEAWIRKQADPIPFEEARRDCEAGLVTLLEHGEEHVRATTQGPRSYVQDLTWREGRIVGDCSCHPTSGRKSEGSPAPLCRHCLAVLLFCASRPRANSVAAEFATECLCPVTRQALRPGERIFQCSACQTAYSQAGWDFLQQVDRGRCCHCGSRKTILPLR